MEIDAQIQKIEYFLVLFSLCRLKQAVIAHPFLCIVQNKHILLDASVCLREEYLNHSNAHEVWPVIDVAGARAGEVRVRSNLVAPCITFK